MMKMLSRSTSAPTLKSIWDKGPSSSPDLRTKTSPFSFSPHHPVTIKKTLSRTVSGLHLRGTPTPTPTSKNKPFHNGYSQFVSENQENGSDMSLGMMSMSVSWKRDAALDERCSAPVDDSGISGGGSGSGGGGCNGRGGSNGNNYGGDGGGENGWFESIDEYYQKIIQDNPHNPLFLGNYAKFLKEVKGDFVKAEEYCGRAILANADEGHIFCLYADLIWCLYKDAARAKSYYEQAVKVSPDDCYVFASYAHFLWVAGEDGEEEEDEKMLRSDVLASYARFLWENEDEEEEEDQQTEENEDEEEEEEEEDEQILR
ncbi:PREDICTED: uncharacterized protein LOC109169566 [Ipomoea nil]|uniref:uncharacterized protein LOC109169566 n=1 Tax=Ipomoea nil TaxID=35883 RepID=UPI000900D87C|nr:PREDICTED: uncharacterized protein LOC109169566 [Ipomoea nil]